MIRRSPYSKTADAREVVLDMLELSAQPVNACPHCQSKYLSEADARGTRDCLNCGGSFQEGIVPADNPDDIDPAQAKDFALKHGRHPHISSTYSIITPESSEQGDYAETGWENERGVDIILDEFDKEEGLTIPMLAAEQLKNHGATEPSSSYYHPGIWYSSHESNYRNGNETERSFHLKNFLPADEEAVYDLLIGKKKQI